MKSISKGTKRFIIRVLRGLLRLLFNVTGGLPTQFVKLFTGDSDLLFRAVRLFVDRVDMVFVAQHSNEAKFFRVDPSAIEETLNGRQLSVFDVGAAGNIEDGLRKYQHLLKVILAEPRDDESLSVEGEDSILVPKLIGDSEGTAFLNICKKDTVSSVLKPAGGFLDYYALGDPTKFEVSKQLQFPMTTIEKVLEEIGGDLDYLKIDTQGTELDVLKGLGEIRPIIIRSEMSFVPLYEDQTIFFHLASHLYDIGYILFHMNYVARGSSRIAYKKQFSETVIPTHGDSWFMPDWTRKKGGEIINGKEREYEALMLMFGMGDIGRDALMSLRSSELN